MSVGQSIRSFVAAHRPFLAGPKRPEIEAHEATLKKANEAIALANRKLAECEEREQKHLAGC